MLASAPEIDMSSEILPPHQYCRKANVPCGNQKKYYRNKSHNHGDERRFVWILQFIRETFSVVSVVGTGGFSIAHFSVRSSP